VVVEGSLDDLRDQAPYRRLEVEVDGLPWTPDIEGTSVIEDNGRAHSMVDASVPVDRLVGLARDAGNITKFSFEPPGLQDLFRRAVGE
jgi:ABC-type uncharacterized transport system ATPase subunit